MRMLLIRLDRIGDLVLTLPVDQNLGFKSSWWIPQGLDFVTRSATPLRDAQCVSKAIDMKGFFKLLGELRRERFDAAIVFHAPWWVSCLLWLARIPIRGGVKSQWHSFLFLNRAVRQKRSRVECSELEYNYRLVESVLRLKSGALPRESLKLMGAEGTGRDELLARFGLSPLSYSVVHPGMGGSALNWPTDRYCEMIENLSEREQVAITGTKGDDAYLAPLRERLRLKDRVVWLDGKLSGPELITVLANARTITAPSTGVMHLAASTGRPTLGIFSPVRVQHPKRWGPHGPRVATLIPEVTSCPGALSCVGTECSEHECMPRISVSSALNTLESL